MPRSPSRVPIFPFPLAFPIICCHFSYPLPVYHFTFVFHYLNLLFPFILPHCRVHSLEQGRAKNDEQADAAEVVVKETFFFGILLISRGPFFVCPHLARFRWLRLFQLPHIQLISFSALLTGLVDNVWILLEEVMSQSHLGARSLNLYPILL